MMPSELPTFEAQWWPVQLETVPGSGERLTVAVVVRGVNGQATVRQAIAPPTLHSIFGEAGKGMLLIVGHTVLDIRRQLDNQVPVELLELPFGNVDLGDVRDCVARDINEVFDIAMRLSTAFSMSAFGVRTEDKSDKEARRAFAEWAEKVRLQVAGAEWKDALKDAFNIAVKVSSRKSLRLGFQYGGYVAQFGVLRPGRTVTADVRAIKLKLFDFDTLRREQLLPVKRAEIVVGVQPPSDVYTKRQIEALAESWRYVEQEARAREVMAVQYNTAAEAARHIYEMAQAA